MSKRRESLPYDLLRDVKAHLNITWTDEATDNRIRSLIGLGMAYIDGKYGDTADYEADGFPRMLLFEYIRYARDSALDVFENNYRSYIIAMQHEREVRAYVESTQPTE